MSYNSLKQYDAAIVLAGIADCRWYEQRKEGFYLFTNYHRFNTNEDRILTAVELYFAEKVNKMLLGDDLNCHPFSESDLIKDFLGIQGVDPENIEVYGQVINTADEAQKSRDYLHGHQTLQDVLLITSAGHMRRAVAAFKKQGLTLDHLSVSRQQSDTFTAKDFVPAAKGFGLLERRLYEVAGYLNYWWRGKI